MEQDQLRRIAEQFLCPFFSGARLAGAVPSTTREKLVARPDPRSLAFKVHSNDGHRLVLRRAEKFGPTAERIVKAFVEVMSEIEPALATAFEADVLRTLPGKIVARTIGGDHHESMLATIDWLEAWADRHYEGMSVTGALGFDPHAQGGSIGLSELSSLEFAAVLSNGVDTMIWVDPRGCVAGHQCLARPAVTPPFAPYTHAGLAAWAVDGRVVLVLTEKDEILVFKDSQMLFAKRSGRWHFLTHRPFVTRMPVPNSLAVRRAVYESCLDASFMHHGACLGVVTAGCGRDWEEVVMREDRLCNSDSLKARTLGLLLAGRTFPELDRRLRMELLSVDGATVIDHQGRVLAVGAILRIPGGSTGGGRLAAARVLATLGLGIKVSQDGSIICLHGEAAEPVFTLM